MEDGGMTKELKPKREGYYYIGANNFQPYPKKRAEVWSYQYKGYKEFHLDVFDPRTNIYISHIHFRVKEQK
jgi:hypothetical protein